MTKCTEVKLSSHHSSRGTISGPLLLTTEPLLLNISNQAYGHVELECHEA